MRALFFTQVSVLKARQHSSVGIFLILLGNGVLGFQHTGVRDVDFLWRRWVFRIRTGIRISQRRSMLKFVMFGKF